MSRAAVIELAEQAGVDVADVLEYWGERAAVREIDGGQERSVAEHGALDDIRELLAIGTWTFERKGPRSAEPRKVPGTDRRNSG
jgi:hypothetical protein